MGRWHGTIAALLVAALALVGGCASGNPDPLEGVNRKVYGFNEFLDRAIVKDVAMTYEKHTPQRVRDSVGNFFNNLASLNTIANDYLQGHFAQGWRNTERTAINTTVGVLGLFDPADDLGRPRTPNDFGITLAKWGVGSGPYLVLPLLGASSARDLPAFVVARVTNPMFWLNPPWEVSLSMDAISMIDNRARLQPQVEFRDRAALDPYTFTRDIYLRSRALRAGEPIPDHDIYEEENYDPAAQPTSAPSAADYMR